MSDKLDLILSELQGMKAEIRDIKEDVGNVKADVGNIKTEVSTLKSEFAYMRNEINIIKAEQKRHEELITQIIGIVKSTNEKVSEVIEEQRSLKQEILAIKNIMATKDDLRYYDQKIAEHDRTLYKIKDSILK